MDIKVSRSIHKLQGKERTKGPTRLQLILRAKDYVICIEFNKVIWFLKTPLANHSNDWFWRELIQIKGFHHTDEEHVSCGIEGQKGQRWPTQVNVFIKTPGLPVFWKNVCTCANWDTQCHSEVDPKVIPGWNCESLKRTCLQEFAPKGKYMLSQPVHIIACTVRMSVKMMRDSVRKCTHPHSRSSKCLWMGGALNNCKDC